jgi:lipopolysaccharide transport system permease protein
MSSQKENFAYSITPRDNLFDLRLRDIWNFRDLLVLFVHRDFVAVYKQTILGPLWFFIQPLLTTLVFTVIFGKVAKIPTDGLPPLLF